jgi:lipopolysaccharide export system permease protein
MFIFVLQTIWLYIRELAGKDLDIIVIGKFLFYFAPKMVPLVLPLTILVASIMVFGQFAENYEFAAMKANGISLQRAMRGLSVFIIMLSVLAFIFANNVIPWAEYESYNLRRNLAKVKPAMAIAEGQFNVVGNINIHVKEKTGDRGQYLKDVTIHQKKSVKRGNYTVIKAKEGELISSEDSNILQLELKDGNYYDEVVTRDTRKYINTKPHVHSTFDTYIINVDLNEFNADVDLDEKESDSRYNMLNISDLNYTIDSLYVERGVDYSELSNTMYNRSTFKALRAPIKMETDSVYTGNNFIELLDDKNKLRVLNLASNTANSSIQVLKSSKSNFERNNRWLNRHIISLHEKYVLGIACIILFFVGAPLGALIRKGGIGLPMVVAILLFLSYHFIGLFAKNSAKDGSLNPVIGTWMSTLIMLPLSIYLTSRATKDRGLFEIDFITVPLKRFFNFKSKSDFENLQNVQSYSYYTKYSDEQLIAIVKDQNEFDLDKRPKQIALQHLTERKVSLETMEAQGLQVPAKLKVGKKRLKDYKDYSKATMAGYIAGTVLLVLHFVFRNNNMPELSLICRDLSIISWVFFAIYVVVSTIMYRKFYSTLGLLQKQVKPLLILLALPFYPLKHLFLSRKMASDYHYACLDEIN